MNISGKLFRIVPEHEDFGRVLDLDQTQFPRPWSRQDWLDLNWDNHLVLGLKLDDQLAGMALFGLVPGDETAHLLKICIEAKLRGTGSSTDFWASCQEFLRLQGVAAVYLEVESTNQRAIGFYRKLGFKTLRTIKGYYSDGTDAMTMQMTT
jgi:ribosomal-protein-alanine N-acetyltransferase